jgi:hypothetical protein
MYVACAAACCKEPAAVVACCKAQAIATSSRTPVVFCNKQQQQATPAVYCRASCGKPGQANRAMVLTIECLLVLVAHARHQLLGVENDIHACAETAGMYANTAIALANVLIGVVGTEQSHEESDLLWPYASCTQD